MQQAGYVANGIVSVFFCVTSGSIEVRALGRIIPCVVWRLDIALTTSGRYEAIERIIDEIAIQLIRMSWQASFWCAIVDRRDVSGQIMLIAKLLQWRAMPAVCHCRGL